MFLKILSFVLLWLVIQPSGAQLINCQTKPQIYFINGIKNSLAEAGASRETLEVRLAKAGTDGSIKLLYNPHADTGASDLDELRAQIAVELKIKTSDASVLVDMAALGYPTTLTSDQVARIHNKLAKSYSQTLAALDLSFTYNGVTRTTAQVLEQFVAAVAASLNSGSKVILVPHSQGNMFANEVFLGVKASIPVDISNSLAVAGVAPPASSTPSGLYLTLKEDWVIWSSSFSLFGLGVGATPLPANITAPGATQPEGSSMGHAFGVVYLSDTLMGTQNGTSKPMSAWVVELVKQALGRAQAVIPLACRPVAEVCPNTFTQAQLAQVVEGTTVDQANHIFGCAGFQGGDSNWRLWYNSQSFLNPAMNTAAVYFVNGVYTATPQQYVGSVLKQISGPVLP